MATAAVKSGGHKLNTRWLMSFDADVNITTSVRSDGVILLHSPA
jgi:hypothetical protein